MVRLIVSRNSTLRLLCRPVFFFSGGMQYAVKFQIEHLGLNGIKRGDVILSNHPRAGGSHLPDFTVITPVSIYVDSSERKNDNSGILPIETPSSFLRC